jgi:hypothetical protein
MFNTLTRENNHNLGIDNGCASGVSHRSQQRAVHGLGENGLRQAQEEQRDEKY